MALHMLALTVLQMSTSQNANLEDSWVTGYRSNSRTSFVPHSFDLCISSANITVADLESSDLSIVGLVPHDTKPLVYVQTEADYYCKLFTVDYALGKVVDTFTHSKSNYAYAECATPSLANSNMLISPSLYNGNLALKGFPLSASGVAKEGWTTSSRTRGNVGYGVALTSKAVYWRENKGGDRDDSYLRKVDIATGDTTYRFRLDALKYNIKGYSQVTLNHDNTVAFAQGQGGGYQVLCALSNIISEEPTLKWTYKVSSKEGVPNSFEHDPDQAPRYSADHDVLFIVLSTFTDVGFYSTNNTLVALDGAGGKELWNVSCRGSIKAVDDTHVYWQCRSHTYIQALDIRTGKSVRRYNVDATDAGFPSVVVTTNGVLSLVHAKNSSDPYRLYLVSWDKSAGGYPVDEISMYDFGPFVKVQFQMVVQSSGWILLQTEAGSTHDKRQIIAVRLKQPVQQLAM